MQLCDLLGILLARRGQLTLQGCDLRGPSGEKIKDLLCRCRQIGQLLNSPGLDRAVYFTLGTVGLVGYQNFGRSVLGCIAAVLGRQ